MSPAARARMGGLMRAHVLSAEERSDIARLGAEAFLRKYGKAGLDRARRGLRMQAVSEQTLRKRRREARPRADHGIGVPGNGASPAGGSVPRSGRPG